MTHVRLDVPTCFDVETGLFRVIFRNPNMRKTPKDWQVDIGTGSHISKIESEPSIKDLIDQQRSFFLLNANQLQRHGIFEAVGRLVTCQMQGSLSGQTHIAVRSHRVILESLIGKSWVSILENMNLPRIKEIQLSIQLNVHTVHLSIPGK